MLQRFLCPTLVSREVELSVLEDALLAANRGDARFVLLEGEAGMGKSRLATAIIERARKLGCAVLSGGCTEAEVALPYLPFIEAIGNYLATQDIRALGARLGPSRAGLAQLFPQLGEGTDQPGDALQGKLRLFEGVASLLHMPASERGLLLIIEDAHWSDAATRELLDHLSRRSTGMRMMVLVTYRSDEIDRKHPLLPLLQSWRRSGIGERVSLHALSPEGAAAMISAILDDHEVSDEFRDLMHARSEGNPFVLEEMLKEAIDRGDVFRAADGNWERRSVEDIKIPDSVADTILLRVARFDPECIEVLQAGAVLGRSFSYRSLVDVSGADEGIVQRALEVAVAQQLVDEEQSASYRWRHALTQEAIYEDIVTPRRQALHSRAADAHAKAGDPAVDIAAHLLGAARFAEAVPMCLAAAAEAEAQLAFPEAIGLYERALPHVGTRAERARLLCKLGIALWRDTSPARAEGYLLEGISLLKEEGLVRESGGPLVFLGRCRWELNRSPEARADFELARSILEDGPPSAELSLAYNRIASLHMFELEPEECIAAARKAYEIAEGAGAEHEQTWAMVFLSAGLITAGRIDEGIEVAEECYRIATTKGFHFVTSNLTYNDSWLATHMMLPRLHDLMPRIQAFHQTYQVAGYVQVNRMNIRRVCGELHAALADSIVAAEELSATGFHKFAWRGRVNQAEVLYELGRIDEAWAAFPKDGGSLDLQDIAYEAAPRMRIALARGHVEDAIALARTILDLADRLGIYRETLGLAAEAFIAAEMYEEAERVIAIGRGLAIPTGGAFLDAAEAELALARGDHAGAEELASAASEVAGAAGFKLVDLRARTSLGEAQAASGRTEVGRATLQGVFDEAIALDAMSIARLAANAAARCDITLIEPARAPEERAPGASVPVGERLITSMFADVRNYTEMTAETPPTQMADKIGTLYRWATAEVERNDGVVNRFAGDAVMATFNVAGTKLDHTVDAVRAAMALRDKAVLGDIPIGIGIGVGPAVVGTVVQGQDMMVTGVATNLAARLQTAASAGEIVLSDEAYRRTAAWLAERGIEGVRIELELKGFEGTQVAYRIPAQLPARA